MGIKKTCKIFLISLFVLSFCIELKGEDGANMRISSSAFEHNTYIPVEFSCQGRKVNPPLAIESIPKAAKSLVLIVDDPDAPGGDFVHWVVYDIKIISRIEENNTPGKQGINSLGKLGYVSPCPPSGAHRYFFKIYALDKMLNLKEGINKYDLEEVMSGHIIEKAELIGLYQKK